MDIERLSADDYVPKQGLNYVDAREMHAIYEKIAFRSNVILVGPKGTGKSLSVAAYAAKKKCPVITFDCSEDVRRAQLIGMFVLRGDKTPFVLGPLTTAYEVANEHGSCILILEELNALTPQMQKVLNPVADFRQSIEVPEAKRVFRLNSGAKLWVVGTMNNSASYGGVYQVNEDLKSRFRMIPVEYPDSASEKKILEAVIRDQGLSIPGDRIVERLLTLAKETRQGKIEYALSTRDLVHVLEDIALVGIDTALWMMIGKYDGNDRLTMTKRIDSTFGIKPGPKKVA